MKVMPALPVLWAVLFFCPAPALAQASIKPLLTQPTQQLAITQGFRDWLGIAPAGPTVFSGAPSTKGGLYAIDTATTAVRSCGVTAALAAAMVTAQDAKVSEGTLD